MSMIKDVLIVDDEEDIRLILSDILSDEDFTTRTAEDADGAFNQINARLPSLIILDIWLQGSRMDGIEILKVVKRDNPDIPVIIISGHGNIEVAVESVRLGAYDFIQKPFKTDQLLLVVERALEASRLRRENADLREKNSQNVSLIGSSNSIDQIRLTLDRVAPTGARVMFTGPSGSGKETAARYLHAQSNRSNAPFVVINAATIEPERMEHVLFGEERDNGLSVSGLLEKAHGGVLYIDSITEMPLGTQSKILRALHDQSFTRVNGTNTVHVDVRIVSASTASVTEAIENGQLREDLYHRLNVVSVEMPPLIRRTEDIPELIDHMIARISEEQGLPVKTYDETAISTLQSYSWPGNIRQLKNIVEHTLILGGEIITENDLPNDITEGSGTIGGSASQANIISLPLREAREAFEREYLITQINRYSGNISRTAAFVGMERSALHRKLKSLGVSARKLH